jgi:hypothetical protein
VGSPHLLKTMVIFASVGLFLLGVAALLMRRRTRATAMRTAAIPGGSHIPTGIIRTPKVEALLVVGTAIALFFAAGISALTKNDSKDAIWFLVVCVALTIAFFRHRTIALAVTVLSVFCSWSWLGVMSHPTVWGWAVTLSSGACLFALNVWLTKKYPEMRRHDFNKFFDRDPE